MLRKYFNWKIFYYDYIKIFLLSWLKFHIIKTFKIPLSFYAKLLVGKSLSITYKVILFSTYMYELLPYAQKISRLKFPYKNVFALILKFHLIIYLPIKILLCVKSFSRLVLATSLNNPIFRIEKAIPKIIEFSYPFIFS